MAKKNYIDIGDTLLSFGSRDFETEALANGYQIRIFVGENCFYDWYFTTGSLVRNKDGFNSRIDGKFLSADEVADKICEHEKLLP